MEILDSGAAARPPPLRRAPQARRIGRAEAAAPAVAGVLALAVFIAWEIARPTLPVPFELAVAARSPGAPSWMGRLPLAALALAGSIAVYIFLARTAERRAAMYAVAVLSTVPAWFVHGRTMTGAMVPMACSAIVLAALGIATLDAKATTRTRLSGAAVAIAAALASVVATRWGAQARGLMAVAGVPALAVGAAGLLWTRANEARTASTKAHGRTSCSALAARPPRTSRSKRRSRSSPMASSPGRRSCRSPSRGDRAAPAISRS
jgi:hypothetical protein